MTARIEYGYWHHGAMYADESCESEIVGKLETVYIDYSDGTMYVWDGASYVPMFG